MAAKRKRPGRPVVEQITDAQRQTHQAIRDFIVRHEYPPTMQELGQALKISGASAHQLVVQLERKGYVTRQPRQSRSLKVVRDIEQRPTSLVSVPIYGFVKAGPKMLAEENPDGEVMVESSLVGRGSCFGLTVLGDSMINAGMREGDVIIVRRQPIAESGEIVVVCLDNETMVKRLSIQGDSIELRSENKRYKPIPVTGEEEFLVLGKVIAIRQQ
ncbi:transcriptional repressor LexA [Anatilimnocola sp. NA78]|uniref:transcriptional repressor LexA n=1 Tax=Anatilimnocola sp. NA78 TaxID=3415683 RepID=UPI003CE59358